MHLGLSEFSKLVKPLGWSNPKKAVALLWYHDCKEADIALSSGELTRTMSDYLMGTPNATTLADGIRELKLTNEAAGRFKLKPAAREVIREWMPKELDGIQPAMNHAEGFLAAPIWSDTRGYIEDVARQLNGCFQAAYYDGAAVMLRRLAETLIIEAYEHLARESEIKDSSGNYFMLKDLVERAIGKAPHKGLNLGRDTKKTLEEIKALGDRSAHNRRFVAKASDMMPLKNGVRTAVEELIQIANLKGLRTGK